MADLINLEGMRFGYYTVIKKGSGRTTKGGQYKTTWVCECVCGNIKEVDSEKLRHGKALSCGCKRSEIVSHKKRENHIGEKYNRLTIIRFLEFNERVTKRNNYLCKCDCGNYIQSNITRLKSGHTKSCGCYEREVIGALNKKYTHSNKRLYRIYRAMRGRCEDEKNKRYADYGQKGIKVCDEWSDSEKGFDTFYEWAMSNGYNDDLTIDRINNYKGYSPSNCRWITNKAQQNNKKYHRYATYKGVTHTIAEWADILEMKYYQVYEPVVKNGKSIDDVINNR